ncbi:MAG: hypothetical protein M9941_18005 [Anaerolineae bacterium]|nr:hypothetical protein [Anaerolineae bacterium]
MIELPRGTRIYDATTSNQIAGSTHFQQINNLTITDSATGHAARATITDKAFELPNKG